MRAIFFFLVLGCVAGLAANGRLLAAESPAVLQPAAFAHHVEFFNRMEDENWTNAIPNANSWQWLQKNIPWFECPDREVEQMYYYRWWVFRKHLVKTPGGYVITEFLLPVSHAGIYNTISCAVGHQIAEGRWLRNPVYLDDYTQFWLRGNKGRPQPHFHQYSQWFTAAVYDRYLVSHDRRQVIRWVRDLVADYRAWEKEKQLPDGLFWQFDVRDGMEESISGSRRDHNERPTLNSYMYGNARALAAIARLAGDSTLAAEFDQKAAALRRLVHEKLWNPEARFFEVRPPDGTLSQVREELGFIPWYFGLPEPGYEAAWEQLKDPQGFRAPYGVTTAERRHPAFRSHGCCRSEWDGAVWPFATSQTLVALGNLLRDYSQTTVTPRDYFDTFLAYVHSQHSGGRPFIGEYLDEVTGQWLFGRQERSRYYNHSTFADLVITGLVGLRPRADDTLSVQPLLPADVWDWFALDAINYHGKRLAICWDKDGTRYGRGAGFSVLADGKLLARAPTLAPLTASLR